MENNTDTPDFEFDLERLIAGLERRAPRDAADLLAKWPEDVMVQAIGRLDDDFALSILGYFPDEARTALINRLPEQRASHWEAALQFPEDTVGRLMFKPVAVFTADTSVADAKDALRTLSKSKVFTYAYCTDAEQHLLGVVVMRDLLFAGDQQTLGDIMVSDPFYFSPEMEISDATQQVLTRHYPVYPVCDNEKRLLGLVHGYSLFEAHTEALTATPGRMVGISNEEHLQTGWQQSLRMRHPWLQVNLLTAFIAAAVVGTFEETISRIVLLAAFLPVLAGQSGNTGCQAMAVTIRGITLDEFSDTAERKVFLKEAMLGLANGALVGITAGIAMIGYALWQEDPHPWMLGTVVAIAMTLSCLISGVTGVLVPLTLKKFGTDPATASSIFLTTATDVVSMGLLLGLATWWLPV